MRANATLEAVADRGLTRCTTMRSSPPLTFRATPDAVYLVGTAAGPLGGDELHISVRVGPGALLTLRSTAATLALPGPTGAPSHAVVDVEVGARGSLHWLPEPLLLVDGCDHHLSSRIRLEPGASLVFRDIVVRGRHREASGSLRQRLDVEVAGRPLLRNELRLGPRWPGADGPAGAGDAHAVAQTLAVGTDGPWCTDQDRPGVRAARMTIDEGVVLLSETARDAGLLTAPYEELRDARPPSPSLPTAGVAPGRSPAPDRPAR